MAESFSREKLRHAPQKEGDEKSCVTPAGTSNELDAQNECEETHTHTHTHPTVRGGRILKCLGKMFGWEYRLQGQKLFEFNPNGSNRATV